MKDHVESCHLTTFDAFRVSRSQVMDLEIWLPIHTNVSNDNNLKVAPVGAELELPAFGAKNHFQLKSNFNLNCCLNFFCP